ncbi:NUMOD3 domain-containing DNA-binding protein [Bacillus cihuensis]|uniref:NUMOD3 domain-containing DNA-binding protein n=1 Tax=Bacillus cihuensis TaxID=1208599 RepID=UPI000429BFB2|nr:NUMOD3 domain-containing DNA-binding protein [Bacillus cihuensis]
MKGKYYVYLHMLNDEVVYVGKGSGSRKYFSHRNEQWQKIVGDNKSLIKIEIVKRFDDEEEAYKFEKELTAYYKSIGQCRANINIGKSHADIIKQKISERGKGKNNSMYGRKFSDKHKNKLSEAHRGERNHLYGKTGADHNCSKPIVAIFPNGKRIEASSKNELSEIMKNEYNVSPSMMNRLVSSGEPLKARYKKHEKLKGLIVQYIGA